MKKEISQFKSHEKIFLTILSLLVIYVFTDYYLLNGLNKKENQEISDYQRAPISDLLNLQTEQVSNSQKQSKDSQITDDEFWRDPEWKERARAYLEKTGGYDSSSQTNYTKEQKRQYVTSLIQSLSKSDIRILNDYLGYIEGGYYFETTGHNDYPNNPEALRYIQLHIHEVIDLLSEK